jgi:aspartate/methionine/tyrosine aminotransferase
MRIETFEMERMQSTWENIVDYDMSESGVRPLTLRELTGMGFDLEAFLDVPLGYSQSNGTIELRERVAAMYPGATIDHVEVTNGTSEANYLMALSQLRPGDSVAMQVPNYMQMWGVARSLGADVKTFRLRTDAGWEPDWEEFDRAVTPGTRLLYLSNPNNPTGSVLSDAAMRRIVDRCEQSGTWLLSDEVYLCAEPGRTRTKSFWGIGERVIVTSGLSKAYGIPGVRIGWLVGPPSVVADCWSQHDYITIGPNLPVVREWVQSFSGRLTWTEPVAGAIGLMKYEADTPSLAIAERVRRNQSTLIVPGVHVGIEGHLRIWLGGREEFLREGLRRIGRELQALFD